MHQDMNYYRPEAAHHPDSRDKNACARTEPPRPTPCSPKCSIVGRGHSANCPGVKIIETPIGPFYRLPAFNSRRKRDFQAGQTPRPIWPRRGMPCVPRLATCVLEEPAAGVREAGVPGLVLISRRMARRAWRGRLAGRARPKAALTGPPPFVRIGARQSWLRGSTHEQSEWTSQRQRPDHAPVANRHL